jgi:acetolactate synthase I/II/III large subunit
MPKMTGAEAIIKSLRQYGVDTIFALPGGQLDHFFDAMYKEGDDIQLVHSRHEQGVAYMAYGYAKSTGKVGVYAVVPGPGLLNSSAALCTAWGNNAQVLCISGQIPSQAIGKGYGDLHEINDQLGMIRHITKWAERIEHPSYTPGLISEAMRQLNTGRPRPVEIEMAMDLMGAEAEVVLPTPPKAYEKPPVDTDLLDQAAQILGKAKRPMIVVGSGALDAGDEVLAVAEALQAPVLSKRSGKGIVSAKHYLHANSPMGHALWAKADAILAVGSRIKEQLLMWGKDDDMKIISIEIDPVEMTRINTPDVGIVGDASTTLQALQGVLDKYNSKRESREDELLALKEKVFAEIRGHVTPQMAYIDVIRDVLPDDGIFVDEVTQVGFVSWYGFETYKPRQHITAGEMGTLGYGFATALGVAVGNPDKKVVQISGDGGFMFNVQELSIAAQYNIPLVSIIFNDNKFTNVQRQQDEWFGGRRICSDLHNPDFAKLAELYGITGYKVDSPQSLRSKLEDAFKQNGPVIIEVSVTERMPTPWKFIMMPQNREYVLK